MVVRWFLTGTRARNAERAAGASPADREPASAKSHHDADSGPITHGAAMESNHPSVGLPRPAGFEGPWMRWLHVAVCGIFASWRRGGRWFLRLFEAESFAT